MPLGNWNLEFLALNAERHYPLAESATTTDASGSFVLPDEFLVGLDLPVHAGLAVDPARFFVRWIGAWGSGFTVTVGYQPAAGDAVDVATALVSRDAHQRNQSYALVGVGDFADTLGKLTVGDLNGIDQQPAGLFEFTRDGGQIEPDCIRPLLRAISALYVANGAERSGPFTGDIELVADENIQLTPVLLAGQNPQIRISALRSEGLESGCVCSGEDAAPCIRRINGLPPTPEGDFYLTGDECLEVQTAANGLKLVDNCSKPCCGCSELEAITRDLELLGSQAATLDGFVSQLSGAITQLSTSVLGSRLSEQGCTQCP